MGALEDVEQKRQRQTRRDDTKLSERGKLLQPEKVSGDMKAKGDHAKEATPAEIEKILSVIKGLYQQERELTHLEKEMRKLKRCSIFFVKLRVLK